MRTHTYASQNNPNDSRSNGIDSLFTVYTHERVHCTHCGCVSVFLRVFEFMCSYVDAAKSTPCRRYRRFFGGVK